MMPRDFGPLWILVLLLLAATLPVMAGEVAEKGQVIGEGVQLPEATPIGEILGDPDAWAGKTVRVEGKVTGVCTRRGCWMELEDRGGERVRIQVEDDVIVFPRDAEGAWAVAQGKVEILELSREHYAGWMRHLAEDRGEAFDETTLGDGPFKRVQIAGTGAEILR